MNTHTQLNQKLVYQISRTVEGQCKCIFETKQELNVENGVCDIVWDCYGSKCTKKNFFLLILKCSNIFINLEKILTNFTLQKFLIAYVFQKPLLFWFM